MTAENRGIREKIAYHWNHKEDYRRNPKLPFWVAPIALAVYILIFYLVYISFDSLPTPLMEADELTHPNRFIAERAQKQLKELTDIGIKVAGSIENDINAVNFLIREIEKIKAASNSIHTIEHDVQVVSGSFYVDFKPHGMSSVYHGVQNVIVKISPAGKTTEHSLMINTHYDTVPVSTGAGDAGCMIVVMLETLRVLSLTNEPLQHSIVFLFNGAEENLLQGAHGFITQHKWAPDVRAFINMDAAGNGGKEIMFQAGPKHPWLLKYYYENAPHPFASVIGEELFDANLIPSDSDFRIFRDYGNISGIDLAYIKNGYVYHTKFDKFESIPLGTYQHTGDNLLALCRALGNAEEMKHTHDQADETKQVFYDVLGWFMMNYTGTTALIVNICLVVLPNVVGGFMMNSMGKQAGVIDWRVCQEYGYSFIVQFLAICVGFGLTLLPAIIFDAAGRSMSWYSQPWLVFGLYFCPMLFSLTFIPALSMMYRSKVFSLSHNIQLLMKGQNGFFILVLCNLTIHSIRSAFLFLIIVFFHTCTQLVSLVTKLQNRPFAWMIVHLLGHLLPFMFFSYLTVLIFTMFIPISARGGPAANPDFLISMISAAMALLMGSLIVPLVLACRKSKLIASGFGIMFIISVIIMVTPVGFPFKAETSAQRYWAFHTTREFNSFEGTEIKSDSGYFMLPMDRYSMDLVKDKVLQMDSSQVIEDDCSTDLSCGIPLYTSRMIKQGPYSHWIPADPPYLNKETVLTLTGTEYITNVKRLHFTINGADHMGIYISPKSSTTLSGWSFYDYIPKPGNKFNEQETYFVYFSYGHNMDKDYTFSLDFSIPGDSWDLPLVDIVLNGHYTHFDGERTPKFLSFINTFPKWAHVTSWMCSYKSYTF